MNKKELKKKYPAFVKKTIYVKKEDGTFIWKLVKEIDEWHVYWRGGTWKRIDNIDWNTQKQLRSLIATNIKKIPKNAIVFVMKNDAKKDKSNWEGEPFVYQDWFARNLRLYYSGLLHDNRVLPFSFTEEPTENWEYSKMYRDGKLPEREITEVLEPTDDDFEDPSFYL